MRITIYLLHDLFLGLNNTSKVLRIVSKQNQSFIVHEDRDPSDTTLYDILVSDLR